MDLKPKYNPEEFDEVPARPEPAQIPAKLEAPPIVQSKEIEPKKKGECENTRQMEMDEGKDLWTKQSKESSKMYQMFLIYMNLRENRSCAKVARIVYGDSETAEFLKTKTRTLTHHAWKWRWTERIKAFDDTVITGRLNKIAKITENYPGKLMEWLDDTVEAIRDVQREKDPQARHQVVMRESEGLAVAMGKRGPRILLDGHKQLYGEKHSIDINKRSVKLNFKFNKETK